MLPFVNPGSCIIVCDDEPGLHHASLMHDICRLSFYGVIILYHIVDAEIYKEYIIFSCVFRELHI